ncbi:MAG: hypothetical protein IPL78_27775 [Chloroflexi bacterium]|nr:hypothetical protein [Chloroflexota bacterium]
MERITQPFDTKGVQIPGYLIERFGYQPGTQVVIEVDTKGIHIIPATLEAEAIERRAMTYALHNIGDAVSVEVEKQLHHWLVTVYGTEELPEPIGYLVYSESGELSEAESTSPEAMWEKAATLATAL